MRNVTCRVLAGVVLLAGVGAAGSFAARAEDQKGNVIKAEDLAKTYATMPEEYDKMYKGKEVTVEGTVSIPNAVDSISKKSFVMLRGFKKAGDPADTQVRCEQSKDLEGLKAGQKVRVRGTAQAYNKFVLAAELKNCTLVKDGK